MFSEDSCPLLHVSVGLATLCSVAVQFASGAPDHGVRHSTSRNNNCLWSLIFTYELGPLHIPHRPIVPLGTLPTRFYGLQPHPLLLLFTRLPYRAVLHFHSIAAASHEHGPDTS